MPREEAVQRWNPHGFPGYEQGKVAFAAGHFWFIRQKKGPKARHQNVIQRESTDSDDSFWAPLSKLSMDVLRSSVSLLPLVSRSIIRHVSIYKMGLGIHSGFLSSLSYGLCAHLSRVETVIISERFCLRSRGMTTYMIYCRFDDTVIGLLFTDS